MKKKSKNREVLYKGPLEGLENSSDYWKTKSTAEKYKEVLSLIEQYMKIKGIDPEEASKSLRTTAVLKRVKL